MYMKPNADATYERVRHKNDLYRKFKNYFIGATEKEFVQYGSYNTDGYISVCPEAEEAIMSALTNDIDEIVPITGSTGIGKTYTLLYCIKTHYKTEQIPTNHPKLWSNDDGTYDLFYYSDFNLTEPYLLEDPANLICAKIKAMCECVMNCFGVSEPDIEHYIHCNKLEVKYYPTEKKHYQQELYKLTILLSMDSVKIKNIVFIFDDLESLDELRQFAVMKAFLALYENFKSKSESRYTSKFFFALRSSTYYNLYKNDFYNTHRARKAYCIYAAPSLSEVFEKRFHIIMESEKVKKAKNKESWSQAKDILVKICERVDASYANLLLKLNNNNISNALDDFLNIVSNRRWTQKSANTAESFKINENDYYINDMNIMRILCQGEQKVFFPSTLTSIRCILPAPGVDPCADLISFMILQAFQYRSGVFVGNDISDVKLLTQSKIIEQITECLISPIDKEYIHKKSKIASIVHEAFIYFSENRFIRENINPLIFSDEAMYFLLPRGEQIFKLFFSQSILFTIFRDTFYLDNKVYNVKCSCDLSYSELLEEAFKYEEQLLELEKSLFSKIIANNKMRAYTSFWGYWSASESFLNGISKSVNQFYKSGVDENIKLRIKDLQLKVNELTELFKKDENPNYLF